MNITISQSKIQGIITAPPSKSYTHRAIILASLAKGVSTIKNCLLSEDTEATIDACKKLGVNIDQNETTVRVKGQYGFIKNKKLDRSINCENSGTTARLITALASLCPGNSQITGSERLQKRPIEDLVVALEHQGVQVLNTRGHLPITVKGTGLIGGEIKVSGKKSSQFISALLLVLPYAKKPSTIVGENIISKPYINITVDIMKRFGVEVTENNNTYKIPKGEYKYTNYEVEGDYSSVSYAIGVSVVSGGVVEILGLNPYSKQGDKKIVDIIKEMGATVETIPEGIKVSGKIKYPITVDLSDTPDLTPTVAALAATVNGKSKIINIAHLKGKESNRIETIKIELQKFGINIESTDDSLTINGGFPKGATIDTHNDHRIAMSMTIPAIIAKGDTVIQNAEVVDKSYKSFWTDCKKIGVNII